MKYFILFIFLCKSFVGFSQKDTSLVNAYFKQAAEVQDGNPDSALVLIQKCKPFIDLINKPSYSYKFYFESARVNHMLGEYEQGLSLAQKALLEAQKLNNQVFILRCNRLLFTFSHRLNYSKKAATYIPLLEKGLEAGIEKEIPGQIYANIASYYGDLEEYNKSISYCEKGIKLAEKYGDTKGMMACYNNTGIALMGMNQYEKAILIYKKQFEIAEKNQLKRNAQLALLNICDANTFFGSTESLRKNLNIYESYLLKNSLGLTNKDSSYYYKVKANYNYRISKFEESLKYMKKWENLKGTSVNPAAMEAVYLNYGELYQAWHKYETANIYYVKSDSINYLINEAKITEYSEEINTRYKVKEKEAEIYKQTLELSKSQNRSYALFGILFASLLLGGLFMWNIRNRQRTKLLETQINAQNLERNRIGQEMHDDLGSNLTSMIYATHKLKTTYGADPTLEKIEHLSGEISDKMNEIVWSLNQDHNNIADWLAYTRGRVAELLENAGIDFIFNIPTSLPEHPMTHEQRRNLYLTIKEAIHNIIKHAKANKVEINILLNEYLKITIKDNGQGFIDSSKTKTGSGNGLSNMQKRMQTIGGSVEWKSSIAGTEVVILAGKD